MNRFLENKIIGLSISESDDIEKQGFSKKHLEDAMYEFSRNMLALGGKIAYGGVIKYDDYDSNFTQFLFNLSLTYSTPKELESEKLTPKVINYAPFTFQDGLTEDVMKEFENKVTFIKMEEPKDAGENLRATSLTAMRKRMNNDIDARIILGGKVKGYTGKYPGIMEEAQLALQSHTPIYLIGAFGGATKCIIDILTTGESSYEAKDIARNLFAHYHISDLNNGLTDEENLTLFTATDIREMIRLVVKGLRKTMQG